jgi:membrane-associated protease RseP (regulator of RpoE activity)
VNTICKALILSGGMLLLAFAVFAVEPETPRPPRPPRDVERDVLIFRSGGSRLGVGIEDINAERAKDLRLREETGVEVRSVAPDSPAAEAGLREGDVILEYQGTRVESAAQLVRMVRETPAGRTVTLKVWRDGAAREFKVQLAERERPGPGRFRHGRRIVIPPIDIPDIEIPDVPELGALPTSVRLGASVENLTDQLGEYFGVKNGEGVLVRSVRKGSPGETGGLRAGDVIVRIDDDRIADTSDLRSALRARRGKEIGLTVVRDRREQKLAIRLPEADETRAPGAFRWRHEPGRAPQARGWRELLLDQEGLLEDQGGVELDLEEATRDLEDAARDLEEALEEPFDLELEIGTPAPAPRAPRRPAAPPRIEVL